MGRDYSTRTDLKQRWGGILENPYVSKIHRHGLDGFKVAGLARIIRNLDFSSLLDVGCGLGEYSTLRPVHYVGLDNSFARVRFAGRWYGHKLGNGVTRFSRTQPALFCQADAVRLPFRDSAFDAVLLANTIHHLDDGAVLAGIREMQRVARRYVIIDDCVKFPGQNRISRFFYSLDRGTLFRTAPEIEIILRRCDGLTVALHGSHRTAPGLYEHAVFVLEKG